MEVWKDKKGNWSYRFEYQGITYTEGGFKSQLDCKSTGALKQLRVLMGEKFIAESPESKEKALFENANHLSEKSIKKPDNSIEKRLGKKQNPEKVSPKVMPKVTPKNEPETDSSQTFTEDGNLESITQSNRESITQTENDLISNDGWIPLFRKSMGSQVFQNEGLWKVWTWCLMRASHTEQWIPVKTGRGKTEVHILPGQVIFGRKTAAKELKMKPPTIQKRIVKLKNMRNIITQSHKHYSLVTLTNWEFYRELQKKGIGKVSGKYQASITYKKNKKEKNIYSPNSDEFRLSELLLNLILKRRDSFKKPDLKKWVKHIDLMIRIDEREPMEIEKVIRWCQEDEFWQNNILSTEKLRKQFDVLALKMNEEDNESSKPKRFDEEDW